MSHRAKAVILGIIILLSAPSVDGAEPPEKPTFVEYLRAGAVPRGVIDGFLRGPSWARFDPELGYVLGNFCDPNLPYRSAEPKDDLLSFSPQYPGAQIIYLDRAYLE